MEGPTPRFVTGHRLKAGNWIKVKNPQSPAVLRAKEGFMVTTELTIGARFKMSELGAIRCPRLAGKTGTVVGNSSRYLSISVRFDGNRTSTSLHRDYIEPLSAGDAGSIETRRGKRKPKRTNDGPDRC